MNQDRSSISRNDLWLVVTPDTLGTSEFRDPKFAIKTLANFRHFDSYFDIEEQIAVNLW